MPTIRETLTRKAADPPDDELAAKLPVGYQDKKSRNYIPPERRPGIAAFDPAITEKMTRQLGAAGQIFRGGHTLSPRTSDDDLETAVLWQQLEWLQREERVAVGRAERDAVDARQHTCRSCRTLVVPLPGHDGVQYRRYPDGSQYLVCPKCAPLVERAILDRLAAEPVDGRTRADCVRAMLGATR